jgi:hypothetical protein
MVLAAPVALSRAVGCVLDNAVRAAGPSGHVTVDVTGTVREIIIRGVRPVTGAVGPRTL